MVLTQVQQSVPFFSENVNVERTTVTTKAPDKVWVNTNRKKYIREREERAQEGLIFFCHCR